MRNVKYKLRLAGLQAPEGKISVKALLDVLEGLTTCAERGLRLAIEGVSLKGGRLPTWLDKAVDLTFSGIGPGSTTLTIEAPPLAEALGAILRQEDFWSTMPAPEDTALSLFSKSVRDTTAENLDSEYYDAGVLGALLDFKSILGTQVTAIELTTRQRPEDNVTLTAADMEKAERLKVRTPEPGVFLISGVLNWIEHSRRRFQLRISDGQIVQGQIDEKELSTEDLRSYWGKKVTVKGQVFFRPSGRIKLLEAQFIKEKESGEEVFEQLPLVQMEAEFVGTTIQAAENRDWISGLWGKWPADESIDDLLQELRR